MNPFLKISIKYRLLEFSFERKWNCELSCKICKFVHYTSDVECVNINFSFSLSFFIPTLLGYRENYKWPPFGREWTNEVEEKDEWLYSIIIENKTKRQEQDKWYGKRANQFSVFQLIGNGNKIHKDSMVRKREKNVSDFLELPFFGNS